MEKSELYWVILNAQSNDCFLGMVEPLGERVIQDLLGLGERCFGVDTKIGAILAEIESMLRCPTADSLALHTRFCRLLELTIDGGRRCTDGDYLRFAAVVQYIDAHLGRPLRVAELAKVAGLSESRF